MHYGVSLSSRAEERKWWDYAGLGPGEHRAVSSPLSVVNCPDLQGLQGYWYLILAPSKTSTAPDLKIILNQRMTVVSGA